MSIKILLYLISLNIIAFFSAKTNNEISSDRPNFIIYLSDDQDFLKNENELLKKEMKSNLISLSDRFALWIGFYDNNKENYIKTIILKFQ